MGMSKCHYCGEGTACPLHAQAGVMAALLAEASNHAERYGGVPKSATKLWDRVRALLRAVEGK